MKSNEGGRTARPPDVRSRTGSGARTRAHDPVPLAAGEWRAACKRLGLTERQVELAWLRCQSWSYKDIARELGISINTVRMHARALHYRLGVHDSVGMLRRIMAAAEVLPEHDGHAAGQRPMPHLTLRTARPAPRAD